ncbi:MAG: flagellar filament capping protein FliD [Pseudomonadota bacterium]
MQITSSGIGSGLDVEGLVTQLVQAERSPTETRLNRQESVLQAELSAYGTLKGALATLQSSLGDVRKLSTYAQRKVEIADNDALGVTAEAAAPVGQFSVSVTSLASAHSLASDAFTSTSDVVGEGLLTIRFGTTDYDPDLDTYNGFALNEDSATITIAVDSSNNTLAGLRDAINNAGPEVSATIVNDGSGYRLLVSGTATGARHSLEISAADQDGNSTDSAGLSAFTFNAGAQHLSQTVAGRDALLTINGLGVASASNRVSDAIEGITIDLKAVTSGPVAVSISRDTQAVKTAITRMVDGYRAFQAVANQLGAFDAESGEGSILLGDATLRATESRIRQVLNTPVDNVSDTFSTLSELGITTDANGTLTINNAKLDQILADNFDELAGMFAPGATILDPDITYIGATAATATGSYDIVVSQLASRGENTGSGVLPDFGGGGSVVIDDTNDALTLEVDGVAGGLLAITHGTYVSGTDLAEEIQTRVNGQQALRDAGISVSVVYDPLANSLTLASTSLGSNSSVRILGIDAATTASLGFSVSDGTTGTDVVGEIGGIAATGIGEVLSGPGGTAIEGLAISVSGGNLGNRGSLLFTRGVADQLDAVITTMLAEGGLVGAREKGIESSIDRIDEDRSDLDFRLDRIEARLRAQFTTLDLLVSQLQGTGSFLTSALASLPSLRNDN